jgi:hypothetical protein
MVLATQNPRHDPDRKPRDPTHAGQQNDASSDAAGAPDAKPARGYPGSFDQPEPNPDVMPREGGPHPEQTAEVPLGTHDHPEPPGARGHNSAPVKRKHGDKREQ